MAIRVTAQRAQEPLRSVWRADSTGAAALWRTAQPPVNGPSGAASQSASGSSHWCRVPVPCGKSWKRGANRKVRCPACPQSLAVLGRSHRDTGMGKVSSTRWPWSPLRGDKTGQRYAFSSSPRASSLTRRPWHRPPPTPRKPSGWQSTCSLWKRGGWPAPPMQAVGRAAGAAPHPPGALMPSPIVSTRSVSPRNGPVEVVRSRLRGPKSRAAIASSYPVSH